MLRIGLTGGIGSGKTMAAKIFAILGIPVYYADDAAKKLMSSNEKLKAAIIANFGESSYQDKQLDRKYLASIVFNNEEKLKLLNSLTHPVTINDAKEWMKIQQNRKEGKPPYIIKEAALLFESHAELDLDYVIGVFAPQHIRIKRVMERDSLTAGEVMKRISRQMDEDEKMKRCDFILTNNEQQLLTPQIIALHEKLIGEFAK
jgi:dephospho-CoA kinase